MRIAIATDLPALGRGGLEALVRELVTGLSQVHEITLVSADDPRHLLESDLGGLIKHHIHVPSEYATESWIKAFTNELLTQGIDICHFHLTGTYGWCTGRPDLSPVVHVASAGIRCFCTNHQAIHPFDLSTTEYSPLRRLLGYLKRLPAKTRSLYAVEREFLVSDHDYKLTCRWFPHMAKKFGRIYHSCLNESGDTTYFPESRIILNLGTVCFRKGQHILTEAFVQIANDFPEWKLRLVGQQAEQACIDQIKLLIKTSGLEDRIQLFGPTSDPQVEILNAEIYVQPSLLEGLGLSLQEAMSYGRPCIASEIGGMPELIQPNENGILVEPNNPHKLSKALAKLMQSRTLRQKLGKFANIAIAEKNMTRNGMLETYQNLYTEPFKSR